MSEHDDIIQKASKDEASRLTDTDLDNVAGGLGGIDGASSGFPDQMNPGGQGSGFSGPDLYAPPTNTGFDSGTSLGPSGSGYKPGGSL